MNPSRPYMRIEIDKVFTLKKAEMHAAAVNRGGGRALYQDCYTGKTLHGGDPYDYEHIYPSEWVFSTYKHILTDEQIGIVANCPENLKVTLRTINQSKGKTNPENWFGNPTNIANHGIDRSLALKTVQLAKAGIEKAAQQFT